MTNPYQDYQRSVATTHSVLEYIRTVRNTAVLVLPSSAAVYGVAQTMPIRVTAPLAPASAYGAHKKVAEDLCRMYGQHFGVRSSLIRFFSVYGVGLRKQLLWDACRKIADGGVAFSGTGQETRDWIHVEDAASLMIRASKYATADSAVVNGGTGRATQIGAIVRAIADEFGDSRQPEFSGICRPGDPVHYQADIAQALDWGWTPTRDLLNEIQRYVHWFKDGAA
jgi:UDP-glucose 4-epimerase